MKIIYLLSLLIAIAANFLLIFNLVFRKERSLTLTTFVLFLFLIIVWAVPQFVINFFSLTNQYFTHLDRMEALGYTFIPVAFLLFTISFSERASVLRRYFILSLVLIPAFIFLFLSWTTNFIELHDHVNIIISPWGFSSPPGPLFPAFLVWFEVLMLISLYILFSVYRNSPNFAKKRQALWLLLSTIVPLSIGTITDGILPIYGIEVLPLGVPLTTITALVIAYAIFKYELFEVSSSSVISSLGDGLISIDTNGKILLVNESAEKMLGIKRRELLGQSLHKKISLVGQDESEIAPEKRPSTLAMKTMRKITSNNYFIKVKNRKFPVSFTVGPMISNKKVTGAIINFRDISEEKELEKSKDEFISVASHELKTPVTALKLYTEVLEKQLGEEGNSKYSSSVSRINYQADRLVNMVGDLLNVSRIQTGKSHYDKKSLRVETLIRQSLLNVKPSVKGRKIVKEGKVDEKIFADRDKLSQVLTNLIINADKYSPENKEIVVKSKANKKEVTISVRDYGIGVPKSKQKKIFKRYFQANDGEGNSSGLGIGLYVSSEIVKNHGGKIWVESTKGKGSIFSFSVPVYKG